MTVGPVPVRARDLAVQGHGLMPQHQGLRVLGGSLLRQEHQSARRPDHEQVAKTDQHERRA